MPKKEQPEDKQLRLLFSTATIASFFAFTQLYDYLIRYIPRSPTNIALVVLSVSAIFSFLYLLTVAASLKYEEPFQAKFFNSTTNQQKIIYNLSVDSFILTPFVLITGKLFGLLQLNGATIDKSMYSVAVLFITLIIIIMLWKLFLWFIAYVFWPQDTLFHQIHLVVSCLLSIGIILFLLKNAGGHSLIYKFFLTMLFSYFTYRESKKLYALIKLKT